MEKKALFSLILPTRDRPRLLETFFQSLSETTVNPKVVEIILYLDPGDGESKKIELPGFKIVRLFGPSSSMGQITQTCFGASSGKYIVLLNDDVIIRTRGWDQIVGEAFKKFPDEIAMVYPNDLYYGKQMSCFPILTRKASILMGNIVPADYQKHSIDSHIFGIFYRLKEEGYNRAVYLKDVIFEHMNFGIGIEGVDQSGKTKENLDDQILFGKMVSQREEIASKFIDEIRSFGSSAPQPLSKKDRVTLFIIMKDGDVYNVHKMIDTLKNNVRLRSFFDSIIILGSNPALRFIKIPKKIRSLIQKQYSITVDSFVKVSFEKAKNTNSEYVAFLFGSSELTDRWPPSEGQELINSENFGVISPAWVNPRTGRIEQSGLGLFRSSRGIEASQLYHGCSEDEIPRNRPWEPQVVGLSGMLVRRDVFLELGGFKAIEGEIDIVGFCLGVKKSGKKIIHVPSSVIYHSEEEAVPRSSLSKWEKDLRLDLEELLREDGFHLHSTENSFYILPTPQKIEDLKDDGEIEFLKKLLQKTLDIAVTFRAPVKDIEYLKNELSLLKDDGVQPELKAKYSLADLEGLTPL